MTWLWVAATPDKYELPMFVADSQTELAQMMGCTPNNIAKTYFYQLRGSIPKRYKVIKIPMEDKT